MTATLVLQSYLRPDPGGWLGRCLASVQHWCAAQQFDYRFVDDALFERVDREIRAKTESNPVIATDLARLALLGEALAEGHGRVIWLDADTLIYNPDAIRLPDAEFAVGRENWVQRANGRWRCYRKVHNAFLMFCTTNPFLEYYQYAATRIVTAHGGAHMVPQLVGPKLLTALHNISPLPVCDAFDVLSPAVIHDLIAGEGPALALWRKHCGAVGAVNLCASSVRGGEISAAEMSLVVECLLSQRGEGSVEQSLGR